MTVNSVKVPTLVKFELTILDPNALLVSTEIPFISYSLLDAKLIAPSSIVHISASSILNSIFPLSAVVDEAYVVNVTLSNV